MNEQTHLSFNSDYPQTVIRSIPKSYQVLVNHVILGAKLVAPYLSIWW